MPGAHVLPLGRAGPGSVTSMSRLVVGCSHGDPGLRGRGVLDDVGERLLDDAVRRQGHGGVRRRRPSRTGRARRRGPIGVRRRPGRRGRRAPGWAGGCRPRFSRSMPSIDRVCSSALRLVSAMTSRLCSAACGSVRITCAPTPACTAISDMLCATTSCRSRAMRSRSSVTAATSCSRWCLPPRPDRVPERPGRHQQGERLEQDRRAEVRHVEQRRAPRSTATPAPSPISASRRRPWAASE